MWRPAAWAGAVAVNGWEPVWGFGICDGGTVAMRRRAASALPAAPTPTRLWWPTRQK
eukprot:gene15580-36003_t